MKKTNARSNSLVIAQAKYEKKRKGNPRLPASYISECENEIFKKALKITGKNKKDTILDGLSLIDDVRDCDRCQNQDASITNESCINCVDFNNWDLRQ